MNYRILSLTLASAALAAAAQDLSTEITVDRTVLTELPAAQPLTSIAPQLPALPSAAGTLRPAQYSRTSAYTPAPGFTPAPFTTGLAEPDSLRGYLWLGYLPVYDRAAGAGYRFIAKENTHAGASVQYAGSNWGASDNAPRKGLDAVDIQGNADHRFSDAARLAFDINYRFTRAGAWNENEYFANATAQKINDLRLRLAFGGQSGRYDYSARVAYSQLTLGADRIERTSIIEAPHDRIVSAALAGGVKVGAAGRFSLELSADVLDDHGLFAMTPAFDIKWQKIDARVGLRVDGGYHFDRGFFNVAPDIRVAWTPSGRFSAYISATGGEKLFTLADQYAISPFLTGARPTSSEFTGIDGRIGLVARPFAGFSAELFGAYTSTLGLMTLINPEAIEMDGSLPYRLRHDILKGIDSKALSGGLKLGYTWRKFLEAKGHITLWQRGYRHGAAANPYRAAVTAGLSATVRPLEPLSISAGWELRAGQRLYTPYTEKYESLPNYSNLSLGGDYAISDRFNVFLRFDNLLCRRTMLIPGVWRQRLGGLAGVSIRF